MDTKGIPKEKLEEILEKIVVSATYMTRPANAKVVDLPLPGIKHHGILLTQGDKTQYFLHKGPKYGNTTDTILTAVINLGRAYEETEERCAIPGRTVLDFYESALPDTKWHFLHSNCITAASQAWEKNTIPPGLFYSRVCDTIQVDAEIGLPTPQAVDNDTFLISENLTFPGYNILSSLSNTTGCLSSWTDKYSTLRQMGIDNRTYSYSSDNIELAVLHKPLAFRFDGTSLDVGALLQNLIDNCKYSYSSGNVRLALLHKPLACRSNGTSLDVGALLQNLKVTCPSGNSLFSFLNTTNTTDCLSNLTAKCRTLLQMWIDNRTYSYSSDNMSLAVLHKPLECHFNGTSLDVGALLQNLLLGNKYFDVSNHIQDDRAIVSLSLDSEALECLASRIPRPCVSTDATSSASSTYICGLAGCCNFFPVSVVLCGSYDIFTVLVVLGVVIILGAVLVILFKRIHKDKKRGTSRIDYQYKDFAKLYILLEERAGRDID